MKNTYNSGRFLWAGWHQFRERARKNEQTAEVFSAREKERFDLDEDGAEEELTSSAKITGEDAIETFIEEPYDANRDNYDVRETNPRRM